mgnify:CR=1 FL=1
MEGYGESEVTSTETSGGVTTTMTGKQFSPIKALFVLIIGIFHLVILRRHIQHSRRQNRNEYGPNCGMEDLQRQAAIV